MRLPNADPETINSSRAPCGTNGSVLPPRSLEPVMKRKMLLLDDGRPPTVEGTSSELRPFGNTVLYSLEK